MAQAGIAENGWVRRIVGRPRLWVGVLWCGIGLAWVLVAVLEGPTASRIILGSIWLALGTLQCVVALLDRRNGRGFYRVPAPTRTLDDEPAEH